MFARFKVARLARVVWSLVTLRNAALAGVLLLVMGAFLTHQGLSHKSQQVAVVKPATQTRQVQHATNSPTSSASSTPDPTTAPASASTSTANAAKASPQSSTSSTLPPRDDSTALPAATVTPFPTRHPGDGPAANYGIQVTKTGPKSISWISPSTATGFYIMFMNQGCSPTIDPIIPCANYFTVPGTTSGSYTFTYGDGNTYDITAVVDVCVNQDVAYCGVAGGNSVSLDF